jgi:hypothetical protein
MTGHGMKRLIRNFICSVVILGGSAAVATDRSSELPRADRDLRILSALGLGILGGGVISALRTRQQRR